MSSSPHLWGAAAAFNSCEASGAEGVDDLPKAHFLKACLTVIRAVFKPVFSFITTQKHTIQLYNLMGNAFRSLFNGDQGIPQTRDRLPWRESLQATPSPPGACLARWSKMENIVNQ